MSVLIYLIPIALLLGFIGLSAFIWSLKSGQYNDLDGAAQRILIEADNKNDWYALQAGADYWVDVDASVNNGAIIGEVELNPWIVGAGVSYRF